MLLLLFGAASALLLLPMLPALVEWRRPSDVVPLAIDPADALDPPGFARNFAERLQGALDAGETRLGQSTIVSVAASVDGAWPLEPREAAATYNRRLWHVAGNAKLPPGQAFLAEVAAWGELRSAPGGLYRALLAGRGLYLAGAGTVLRWAHAREVEVASGCRLAGRVSAEQRVVVHEQVRFTLLHAPEICFTGSRPSTDADAAVAARGDLPAPAFDATQPVEWDAIAERGVASTSLDIPSGRVWQGDLVCRGRLRLGTGCHARGSL